MLRITGAWEHSACVELQEWNTSASTRVILRAALRGVHDGYFQVISMKEKLGLRSSMLSLKTLRNRQNQDLSLLIATKDMHSTSMC